ncbi:hypothetical protein C8R47DRAFT_1165049 [Mycena vitilis]|nr:hypothetical protein C8R47DRAFT_1165049 [Mycena vitilis]
MAASSVLRIPELCSQVTDFLHDSNKDLVSCALVSTSFTSAAQRHLFHDLIFEPGCLDIEDLGGDGLFDGSVACRRVCSILRKSPHLQRLVRRLRASLEGEVLEELHDMQFPNLATVFITSAYAFISAPRTVRLASQLIARPSIRRVGLVQMSMTSVTFNRLFEKATGNLEELCLNHMRMLDSPPTLDPLERKTLKTLHVRGSPRSWGRLLFSSFPFDLSTLETIESGGMDEASAAGVLAGARLTLKRMDVDTPHTYDLQLSNFPSLTDLSLWITVGRLETVFAALLPGNRLEHLLLVLCITTISDPVSGAAALDRLARALPATSLPALRTLELNIPAELLPDTHAQTCAAFHGWGSGRVEVRVVVEDKSPAGNFTAET